MAGRKKTTLKEIGETLAFIVERMVTKSDAEQFATKDDVRQITREVIREEVPTMIDKALKPIHAELREIRREIDELREQFENVTGFRKEIDHALERIGAIEKHLGINKKIAA